MESPINPMIWKVMFNVSAVTLSTALVWSLWRQRCAAFGRLNDPIRRLKSKKPDEVEAALREIASVLDEEAQTRKGASKMGVRSSLTSVLKHVKYPENEPANLTVIALACKIFVKACDDDAGRVAFHDAGGYRRLMYLLAEANRHSNLRVMEEAAFALYELTSVDPANIVLPADVPYGSEGTYALALFPSTTKMLRTLDPHAKASLLVNVVGAFANISVLQAGAKALQVGVDDRTGAWYFLRLLHHNNDVVIERAARALRFLVNNGSSQHADVCHPENVKRLVLLLKEASSTQDSLLMIIRIMLDSPLADKFFTEFVAEDGVSALFHLWCQASEKITRDRAETLVHVLEKNKAAGATVTKLMELNRANIHERRAKDEEARRKQLQQMKQQQMFEQMMMQQMMGGGGGMPPGMMDDDE